MHNYRAFAFLRVSALLRGGFNVELWLILIITMFDDFVIAMDFGDVF